LRPQRRLRNRSRRFAARELVASIPAITGLAAAKKKKAKIPSSLLWLDYLRLQQR